VAVPHASTRVVRKASRRQYARSNDEYRDHSNYYDYYDAREVNEDLYGRSEYGQQTEQSWQNESNSRESYAYGDGSGYSNSYRNDAPPSVTLDSRDFSGGVGYGQNGDMYYQGGYGRGGYDMNGGGMANAAAARISVWHGYNSRSGLGNGY
jgi:hypothetical protein